MNEAPPRPGPSARPCAPLPASERTEPSASATVRTRKLFESLTYKKRPSASAASARGLLNDAPARTPSAQPATPLPARVDTNPLPTSTARTAWFKVSATYRVPVAPPMASPLGALKRALAPLPSRKPVTPGAPASVATAALAAPGESTLRSTWLPRSATKSAPLPFSVSAPHAHATEVGEENFAAAAGPSPHAAKPLPASVATPPPAARKRKTWLLVSANATRPSAATSTSPRAVPSCATKGGPST